MVKLRDMAGKPLARLQSRMNTAAFACIALLVSLFCLSLRSSGIGGRDFTLIVRSRDPILNSPPALKHYSRCRGVGAVRIIKDDAVTWNLSAAYQSLTGRKNPRSAAASLKRGDGRAAAGYDMDKLAQVLEDASVPERFIKLLDARPRGHAAFLVSDDLLIDCTDVDLAFEAWQNRTGAIVGTMALSHVMWPDSGQHAWLDYRVSSGVDGQGSYSMVSLNGAFVSVDYMRQASERHIGSADSNFGCDEVWINHLVAMALGQPPVHVQRSAGNNGDHQRSVFNARSSVYADSMSRCLSRIAGEHAGRLGLLWARETIRRGGDGRAAGDVSSSMPRNATLSHPPPTHAAFPMIDDADCGRRKFTLSSDRNAGVTVVLVMDTRPNEAASAVRHLHSRHAFIREAVVWNNKNETMNHHMFPYDIAVRYVIAQRSSLAYARYLGCLLARYDICYFQHEKTRPLFVAGLYAAFLTRPDVVVAASDPQSALLVRRNMTFFDTSSGRRAGFADMDEGAMIHKDLARQFVQRMSLDDSRSFYERAADADIYFTMSQPTPPMILTHATRTNNKPRVFPMAFQLGKALAFTFAFAPDSRPAPAFQDATSPRYRYFKAPCSGTGNSHCAFATNLDAWPRATTINLAHDKPGLKPSRYYADLIEHANRNSSSPPLSSSLNYHAAVDGDIKTTWRVQLSSRPSFVGLELSAPTVIVGVNLWCKGGDFAPIPTLQLGFFGHAKYFTAWCSGEWKTDAGDVRLLTYKCPPLRVNRVRLVIDAPAQMVEVAEFAVEGLQHTQAVEIARNFSSADSAAAAAATAGASADKMASALDLLAAPPPPDVGTIAYVLHGEGADDYLTGEKLALLEEACELGALYRGKVKLVYAGGAPRLSLQALARVFAVVGSTCALEKHVAFERVPIPSPYEHADQTRISVTPPMTKHEARMAAILDWWTQRNLNARVVFFEPRDTPLLFVLRHKTVVAPNAIFVVRAAGREPDMEESVSLADATLVSSKADFDAQSQVPGDWEQDRRILYPLRTVGRKPGLLETPTTPAIEEVVVLVTHATTAEDIELFTAHALPILQERADVRLANVTALQHELINGGGAGTAGGESADAQVKRPKWMTLRDVVYYVGIYPARVLWVLDTTPGAAYYASFASSEAARFVASAAAVPHTESRMLAWNVTCEWTPEGFAGKARELLQASFNLSSSFADRIYLRHDASTVVVEEWPIKRLMTPFVNPVSNIVRYLAELVSAQEVRMLAGNARSVRGSTADRI